MSAAPFRSGFVAILGRPNAGKSTLLNYVLGAKVSIVTPKAQTTREKVLGILTDKASQMIFIDTPGVHTAREGGLNEYMVNQAREAVEQGGAVCVWYMVDPKSALLHEQPVLDILTKAKTPVFLIFNKLDRYSSGAGRLMVENLAKTVETAFAERGIKLLGRRSISAQTGEMVPELLEETRALLPEGPHYYPDDEQISDRPTRYFVAEKIREQLLLQLGEEVPYSCAVEIESFDEKSTPPRIEATIHVERDSQKGIVVGKGGAKIKAIGQAAREQTEEFLGQKVFLGLKVKLLKDWSRDADALRRLGYALPPARKKPKK